MASIGIRQNQYIFIFTIATVFYLPLGFVTVCSLFYVLQTLYMKQILIVVPMAQSIFGMHLYDTNDPNIVEARYKFWVTLAIIAMTTWTVAGIGYWVVRKGKKDDLKRALSLEQLRKMTEKVKRKEKIRDLEDSSNRERS